jgi:ABC-type branched-subunit amino acid transport system substrate-binding protein
MKTKLKAAVALSIASMMMLAGCSGGSSAPPTGSGADAGPIKVGVVAALTGIAAPYGVQGVNSLNLAVKDLNAMGGINGRDVEVVVVDNGSKPEEVPALMRRLASDGVSLIVGASSTPLTITAAQTADQIKMPLLVPMEAADAIIGDGRKYVFKLAPSPLSDTGWAAQGIRAVMTASEDAKDPVKSVVIVHASSGAFPEAKEGWTRTLAAEYPDVKVLDTIAFDEAATSDFSPIVAKARETNPDVVIFGGNPQSAFLFYPALEESGWQPKATLGMLGGNTNAQFVPTVGKAAAQGDFAGNYWTALLKPGENAKQTPQGYVDAYAAAFDGQTPDGVGAYYYSAVGVIADALSTVDNVDDHEAVVAALRGVDIKGINGDKNGLYIVSHGVSFDDKGFNTRADGLVTQIDDGAYVPVFPADVATGTAIYPKR